eukprot:scaffold3836_cov87-Skeletonema_dohrnii-CCMP3373.AAC.4
MYLSLSPMNPAYSHATRSILSLIVAPGLLFTQEETLWVQEDPGSFSLEQEYEWRQKKKKWCNCKGMQRPSPSVDAQHSSPLVELHVQI